MTAESNRPEEYASSEPAPTEPVSEVLEATVVAELDAESVPVSMPVSQSTQTDRVYQTRRPRESEELLQEKFVESIVNQSVQMDKLAQQLIVLELAIPGVYATVLQLVQGADATLSVNYWNVAAFGLWLLSLLLTFWSLMPRAWRVDPTRLKPDALHERGETPKSLTIEQFFTKSAQRKRRYLMAACVCFWAGIVCATWIVF